MAGRAVFKPCTASSHSLSNSFRHLVFVAFFICLLSTQSLATQLSVDVTEINMLVDETFLFKLIQIGEYNTTLTVNAHIQHPDMVQFVPPAVELPGSSDPNDTARITHDICAYGKNPGHTGVMFNVTPPGFVNMDNVFIRMTVMHSHAINVISYIMGWVYFVAWSVSFYPQIYINYKRKSVVGLNFDFVALNIYGFTMYSLFNCGLFFSKGIQTQYFERHPRGLNPVQLNDVFFSLHAAFATLVTIVQCFMYERANQRISLLCRGLISVFSCVVLVSAGLAAGKVILWLDFLYYCSYIKLCITLIKYVPQAYMNYKRKSTVGWSIGNIFLDFVGGFLSVAQMLLNAYNFDDWVSFFGDATKCGLGLFSLGFDIFFMLQHYVFYRYADTGTYAADSGKAEAGDAIPYNPKSFKDSSSDKISKLNNVNAKMKSIKNVFKKSFSRATTNSNNEAGYKKSSEAKKLRDEVGPSVSIGGGTPLKDEVSEIKEFNKKTRKKMQNKTSEVASSSSEAAKNYSKEINKGTANKVENTSSEITSSEVPESYPKESHKKTGYKMKQKSPKASKVKNKIEKRSSGAAKSHPKEIHKGTGNKVENTSSEVASSSEVPKSYPKKFHKGTLNKIKKKSAKVAKIHTKKFPKGNKIKKKSSEKKEENTSSEVASSLSEVPKSYPKEFHKGTRNKIKKKSAESAKIHPKKFHIGNKIKKKSSGKKEENTSSEVASSLSEVPKSYPKEFHKGTRNKIKKKSAESAKIHPKKFHIGNKIKKKSSGKKEENISSEVASSSSEVPKSYPKGFHKGTGNKIKKKSAESAKIHPKKFHKGNKIKKKFSGKKEENISSEVASSSTEVPKSYPKEFHKGIGNKIKKKSAESAKIHPKKFHKGNKIKKKSSGKKEENISSGVASFSSEVAESYLKEFHKETGKKIKKKSAESAKIKQKKFLKGIGNKNKNKSSGNKEEDMSSEIASYSSEIAESYPTELYKETGYKIKKKSPEADKIYSKEFYKGTGDNIEKKCSEESNSYQKDINKGTGHKVDKKCSEIAKNDSRRNSVERQKPESALKKEISKLESVTKDQSHKSLRKTGPVGKVPKKQIIRHDSSYGHTKRPVTRYDISIERAFKELASRQQKKIKTQVTEKQKLNVEYSFETPNKEVLREEHNTFLNKSESIREPLVKQTSKTLLLKFKNEVSDEETNLAELSGDSNLIVLKKHSTATLNNQSFKYSPCKCPNFKKEKKQSKTKQASKKQSCEAEISQKQMSELAQKKKSSKGFFKALRHRATQTSKYKASKTLRDQSTQALKDEDEKALRDQSTQALKDQALNDCTQKSKTFKSPMFAKKCSRETSKLALKHRTNKDRTSTVKDLDLKGFTFLVPPLGSPATKAKPSKSQSKSKASHSFKTSNVTSPISIATASKDRMSKKKARVPTLKELAAKIQGSKVRTSKSRHLKNQAFQVQSLKDLNDEVPPLRDLALKALTADKWVSEQAFEEMISEEFAYRRRLEVASGSLKSEPSNPYLLPSQADMLKRAFITEEVVTGVVGVVKRSVKKKWSIALVRVKQFLFIVVSAHFCRVIAKKVLI